MPAAVTTPLAPTAVDVAPQSSGSGLSEPPRTGRWNVHDVESRVEIDSAELFASARSRVTRFRGFIASKPDRLVVDFDLRALDSGSRVITAIIQEEYLEIDTYPSARLDVVIERGVATGTLELHGVRRGIRFPATVERAPGRVRVHSAFTLKRHDFGIVRQSGWDWIAREEVGVVLDVVAAPERVTVEEIE